MKVEDNIYYDERCPKNPYSVNVMRNSKSLTKKYTTLEDARKARDEFIRYNTSQPTDDPDVFIQGGVYILEFTVYKEFESMEKAVEKAKILRKFMRVK